MSKFKVRTKMALPLSLPEIPASRKINARTKIQKINLKRIIFQAAAKVRG